ncbi:6-hydroxypseudooxynicotine dehydrogenase complex subunit alpha [Pigmentiphaga humi]|uniref:6-hydroxypseudooxynicotine dehydrogenase complex subunit alpha n=1 Tax=Pigmentiphaga humi TaxID=2478468 RepID=A0A3P4AX42_9BURK|nr:xanthine dehydrogenase family protein subunit M [Pigmentiphaga humi]VCU68613.1 6-hydroxypseudooxynicotine dehydrogenase complex subunit alpha [Pigmentiphaga humi]
MKAPAVEYVRPASLDEALQCLGGIDNARVLAGGQSLMAMLNMRFAFPDCLVDINRIPELSYIRDDGDAVHIGAMTRQREVEFSDLVASRLPILREAILNVGHRQTRNRGTVGGSLCQLDPSAEIPTIAMAMDAEVQVGSAAGRRGIAMADFPAGYMTPALQPDEMVLGVSLRPWDPGHGSCFLEFSRRHGDFAIASAAVLLQFGPDDRIARCSITLGGCASAPVRMPRAEQALLGTPAAPGDIERAAGLCAEVEASTDSYVPGWYRQRLARVLASRAITGALARTTR